MVSHYSLHSHELQILCAQKVTSQIFNALWLLLVLRQVFRDVYTVSYKH